MIGGDLMSGNLFYPLLSTGLILVTIFIFYLRRTSTDHYQRKVYFSVLVFIFAAIVTRFAGTMLEGRGGETIRLVLKPIFTLFIIFQQCSYYSAVVLLDYLVNKNSARTKKFIIIAAGFMALNIAVLIMNYLNGFYFYISDNNYYTNGSLFIVRFYMSYAAVLIAIVDIFLSRNQLRAAQMPVVVYFAVLSGIGAVLDIVLPGGNLLWAFLTTAMLITYFYIIHGDTTLDSVTGISNRSGFIEFINRISQANARQSYTMILFDIFDFKKINDEHGRATGDKALAEMATLLKQCTRQYDFIARLSDDEFVVAIKSQYSITQLISRILRSLNALNKKPDRQYDLAVNFGYDTYITNDEHTPDDLLQILREKVFQQQKAQRSEAANKRMDVVK